MMPVVQMGNKARTDLLIVFHPSPYKQTRNDVFPSVGHPTSSGGPTAASTPRHAMADTALGQLSTSALMVLPWGRRTWTHRTGAGLKDHVSPQIGLGWGPGIRVLFIYF